MIEKYWNLIVKAEFKNLEKQKTLGLTEWKKDKKVWDLLDGKTNEEIISKLVEWWITCNLQLTSF
jgi:hypothetical protein